MNLQRIHAGAAAVVLVSAGALSAAELSPRYEAIGEMTVELGGEVMDLVIAYDKQKDSAYAEQKMIMGSFLTINSVGQTVAETGKPGRPMVQVTLQRQSGSLKLLSAELFDEQGYDAPMVMGADGGKGAVTGVSLEDDHLEAVVEGSFLRLTGYMKGTPAPAEGAEPRPVKIRWSVDLPPLK